MTVSVVVLARQGGFNLERCVGSARNQTGVDTDVLVWPVDDAQLSEESPAYVCHSRDELLERLAGDYIMVVPETAILGTFCANRLYQLACDSERSVFAQLMVPKSGAAYEPFGADSWRSDSAAVKAVTAVSPYAAIFWRESIPESVLFGEMDAFGSVVREVVSPGRSLLVSEPLVYMGTSDPDSWRGAVNLGIRWRSWNAAGKALTEFGDEYAHYDLFASHVVQGYLELLHLSKTTEIEPILPMISEWSDIVSIHPDFAEFMNAAVPYDCAVLSTMSAQAVQVYLTRDLAHTARLQLEVEELKREIASIRSEGHAPTKSATATAYGKARRKLRAHPALWRLRALVPQKVRKLARQKLG